MVDFMLVGRALMLSGFWPYFNAGLNDNVAGLYSVRDAKPTPQIELGVEMRADGNVKRILQVFGTYAVEAQLDHVEVFKDSGC